jgi:hypothetical protein
MSFRSWIRWCQIRHHCNRDPFFRFNILTFMFTTFISLGLMLFRKSFVLILLVLFWISFTFFIFRFDTVPELFCFEILFCFGSPLLFYIFRFGCIELKTASLLSNKDHVAHILHKINVLICFVFVFDSRKLKLNFNRHKT